MAGNPAPEVTSPAGNSATCKNVRDVPKSTSCRSSAQRQTIDRSRAITTDGSPTLGSKVIVAVGKCCLLSSF